jgi:hypothetical protein
MDHMTHVKLQDKDHYENMLIWCQNNIGEIKQKWAAINYGDASATFIFRNEQDLLQFKLAWIG